MILYFEPLLQIERLESDGYKLVRVYEYKKQ